MAMALSKAAASRRAAQLGTAGGAAATVFYQRPPLRARASQDNRRAWPLQQGSAVARFTLCWQSRRGAPPPTIPVVCFGVRRLAAARRRRARVGAALRAS